MGAKFIIATGSTANVPPIEGISEAGFVTHIEALKMPKQPQGLIVIGAGPLGLEFAQMFSRFGTKVTILQRGSSIFSPGEQELTNRLAQILTKEGITIKTNVEVKNARKEGVKKIVSYTVDGKREEVSANEILLAAGKTPNTQGLGLDVVGVEIDQRQAIIVNQYFQTSNKNIFAVGDVASLPLRLETIAGREGTLAAENALKGTTLSIDYNAVPYTIFTDPQLAGVGWTEEEQMKQMGVCACRTVSFEDIPKAIIMRRTEGLIKMAIHPQTKQILGVHILAPNAGELIAQAMMLVKNMPALMAGAKITASIFSTAVFLVLALVFFAIVFVIVGWMKNLASRLKDKEGKSLPVFFRFKKELFPVLLAFWSAVIVLFLIFGWDWLWVIGVWASVTTIMLWPCARHFGRSYLSYRRPLFIVGVFSMAALPILGFLLDFLPKNESRAWALLATVAVLTIFSIVAGAKSAIDKPTQMLFRPDLLFGDGRVLATGVISLGLAMRFLFGPSRSAWLSPSFSTGQLVRHSFWPSPSA